VKAKKGLSPDDNLFDYAGPLELSANEFQMNLVADVIQKEAIRGEQRVIAKKQSTSYRRAPRNFVACVSGRFRRATSVPLLAYSLSAPTPEAVAWLSPLAHDADGAVARYRGVAICGSDKCRNANANRIRVGISNGLAYDREPFPYLRR